MECPEGTVPGWMNEQNLPTSCVDNHAVIDLGETGESGIGEAHTIDCEIMPMEGCAVTLVPVPERELAHTGPADDALLVIAGTLVIIGIALILGRRRKEIGKLTLKQAGFLKFIGAGRTYNEIRIAYGQRMSTKHLLWARRNRYITDVSTWPVLYRLSQKGQARTEFLIRKGRGEVMANRNLVTYTEKREHPTAPIWRLKIDRSASGKPALLFTIVLESLVGDDEEMTVVVDDGNELLKPVLEWLGGS